MRPASLQTQTYFMLSEIGLCSLAKDLQAGSKLIEAGSRQKKKTQKKDTKMLNLKTPRM